MDDQSSQLGSISFLDLPPELRNMVYELALPPTSKSMVLRSTSTLPKDRKVNWPLSLVLVSKQIHAEVYCRLLATSSVGMSHDEALTIFNRLDDNARNSLHNLVLNWRGYDDVQHLRLAGHLPNLRVLMITTSNIWLNQVDEVLKDGFRALEHLKVSYVNPGRGKSITGDNLARWKRYQRFCEEKEYVESQFEQRKQERLAKQGDSLKQSEG